MTAERYSSSDCTGTAVETKVLAINSHGSACEVDKIVGGFFDEQHGGPQHRR